MHGGNSDDGLHTLSYLGLAVLAVATIAVVAMALRR